MMSPEFRLVLWRIWLILHKGSVRFEFFQRFASRRDGLGNDEMAEKYLMGEHRGQSKSKNSNENNGAVLGFEGKLWQMRNGKMPL